MKHLFIITLILVFTFLSAHAQIMDPAAYHQSQNSQDSPAIGSSAHPMNLRDCMLYAIDNSRSAKIQEAKNEQARLNHREAYLQWVPYITGQSQANTSFGRSIDPETNIYTTSSSFFNSYGISASYTIFDGFNVVNSYRITKIAKMAGVDESQIIEDDICLKTIQAYYNVVYRLGMVDITAKQLDESKENLHQAQVMEELGIKGHADVLQVEAKLAEDDYNHTKADNELADAIITLKKVMFYPIEDDLNISTDINIIVNPYLKKESSDSIFNSAKEFLPDIKVAKYNERTAQLKYQTAKLKLIPKIVAGAGIESSYNYLFSSNKSVPSFFNQLDANLGEYVAVQLNFPIFTGLSKYNDIGKAKNDYKIAQFQKEQKLQEVSTTIAKAVQDMEGAAKEYIQSDKSEKSNEIAYQANQQKYIEGMVSILDLQTSSNKLLSARAQKLYCAMTYLLKTKIVDYYKGIPYLSQE